MYYNPSYDMCCNGVLTTGVAGTYAGFIDTYKGTECCGTVAYVIGYGLCCDGVVDTSLYAFMGDTCPGVYVNEIHITLTRPSYFKNPLTLLLDD